MLELKNKKIPRPHRQPDTFEKRTGQRALIYYTYVLESFHDGKLYVGWTNNLKQRLTKHNGGKVVSTKARLPLRLIYFEGCLSQDAAIKREKYFKTGFGRRFLTNRLAGSRGGRVGHND